MTKKAAKTGPKTTAVVAIEQHFPDGARIINDDLAYRTLPFAMRAFVRLTRPAFVRDWMVGATEKGTPGIWAMVMCRKRYIDDKAAAATGGQTEAVVNLRARCLYKKSMPFPRNSEEKASSSSS
jgi:O-methyltransferase involved in polyketide biosynthesis